MSRRIPTINPQTNELDAPASYWVALSRLPGLFGPDGKILSTLLRGLTAGDITGLLDPTTGKISLPLLPDISYNALGDTLALRTPAGRLRTADPLADTDAVNLRTVRALIEEAIAALPTPTTPTDPNNPADGTLDFDAQTILLSLYVTDTSTIEGTAKWRFGDGTDPVTGPVADHAYTEPGSYNITLELTDTTGTAHTLTRTLTLYAADDANTGDDSGTGTGGATFDPVNRLAMQLADGSPVVPPNATHHFITALGGTTGYNPDTFRTTIGRTAVLAFIAGGNGTPITTLQGPITFPDSADKIIYCRGFDSNLLPDDAYRVVRLNFRDGTYTELTVEKGVPGFVVSGGTGAPANFLISPQSPYAPYPLGAQFKVRNLLSIEHDAYTYLANYGFFTYFESPPW